MESCRHHWIIETPNGPMSRGRCRKCGIERHFNNGEGMASWREVSEAMREVRILDD